MAVPVVAQADFASGAAKALFFSLIEVTGPGRQYEPTRDGKGFLFLRPPAVNGSPLTVISPIPTCALTD